MKRCGGVYRGLVILASYITDHDALSMNCIMRIVEDSTPHFNTTC